MFVTNHVLAGTIVGTALRRRPALAFAVGIATHIAMDLTPHWGDGTGDREHFYEVARRDGTLGLATIAAVTALGRPPRAALLAGIAGAALLDADKPCEYFFGVSPFPAWLNRFHTRIQRESPEGLANEVVAGASLGSLAFAALRRQRRLTRGGW